MSATQLRGCSGANCARRREEVAKLETDRLDLGEHLCGYEWEAGETPPGDAAPGKWVVRKVPDEWVVLFRSRKGAEYLIQNFSPTDDGEKAAKGMALRLIDIDWGRGG